MEQIKRGGVLPEIPRGTTKEDLGFHTIERQT